MSDTRRTPRNAFIIMEEEEDKLLQEWLDKNSPACDEKPIKPVGMKGKPPRRNRKPSDRDYEDYDD